ncbi:MAG: YaaR family protein [Deltaproteobacteria bacterium]
MKIRHSFELAASKIESEKKDSKKIRNSKESSFQSQYKKNMEETVQEKITRLLNDIDDQGKTLGTRIDIRELKVYKQLISEFLYEVVNNSHVFSKESKVDRRGRHRVWAVIKLVNEELENLTKEVLKEETDNIKILKSMEDIRGLLLDITM